MKSCQNCLQTRPIYSCTSFFFSWTENMGGGGGGEEGGLIQLNVAYSNMDNTMADYNNNQWCRVVYRVLDQRRLF